MKRSFCAQRDVCLSAVGALRRNSNLAQDGLVIGAVVIVCGVMAKVVYEYGTHSWRFPH